MSGPRKLTLALKEAKAAAEHTGTMMELIQKMGSRQRKIFLELTKGRDELQAIIAANAHSAIGGIVKKVYVVRNGVRKGKMFEGLTYNDLQYLEAESYQRLLSIARYKVQELAGNTDYRDYMVDIQDFFKLVAPQAFAIVSEIMGDENVKTETRLAAAKDILDRSGYKQASVEQGSEMPVKVIFNLEPQKVVATVEEKHVNA